MLPYHFKAVGFLGPPPLMFYFQCGDTCRGSFHAEGRFPRFILLVSSSDTLLVVCDCRV